jgi:hypothetical protein
MTRDDVSILLTGDADVYLPSGEMLVALRRENIPQDIAENAYPALHSLKAHKSNNRGNYAGEARVVLYGPKNTTTTPISTAIVGFFDRQGGRHPYCRQTAFSAKEVEAWETIVPMAKHVGVELKTLLPNHHARMMEIVGKTDPAWVISGTPFTTLTVNNNVVAATHQDKGDFKNGFGCMSVARRGHYEGAFLMFPEWGVGVDMRDRDLMFFNPHEWHANTPFENAQEGHERISIVYYFREKMVNCGTIDEELANARKVSGKL